MCVLELFLVTLSNANMKYKVCNKPAVLVMSKADTKRARVRVKSYRSYLRNLYVDSGHNKRGKFSIFHFMKGDVRPTTIPNNNVVIETYYYIIINANQVMETGLHFLETLDDTELPVQTSESIQHALDMVNMSLTKALNAIVMVKAGLEDWDGKTPQIRLISKWCDEGQNPKFYNAPEKLCANCKEQIDKVVEMQSKNIAAYNAEIAKTESAMTNLCTFTDFALQ